MITAVPAKRTRTRLTSPANSPLEPRIRLEDPSKRKKGGYIPQLDGLRGLAAIAVAVTHTLPRAAQLTDSPIQAMAVRFDGHTAMGNLAVVLFLSLSGFLLTFKACNEMRETGKFSVPRFWLRRILRIWPLYFVVLGVLAAIYSHPIFGALEFGADPSHWIWLRNHLWTYLCFLSNWPLAFNYMGGYTDHSPAAFRIFWSIAVEEQFYLIYPFIFVLAFRFPKCRFWIVFLALVFAIVFRAWFAGHKVDWIAMKNTGGMYYATLTYLDVVAVGCACGWICSRLMRTKMQVPLLNGQAGVLLIVLCGICGWIWSVDIWFPYKIGTIFVYSAMALIFGALLLWFSVTPGHWLSKLLASPPMRILGSLSFGIYLWHIIAGRFVASGGQSCNLLDSSKFPWVTMAATMILTLIFASATRICVELPFLRMRGLSTRFQRRLAR
jgi:peptidoglycan/LPS O-acetylase OafA/YrhL